MRQRQHHFSGFSDTDAQLEPLLREHGTRVTTVQNQQPLQVVKGMKVTYEIKELFQKPNKCNTKSYSQSLTGHINRTTG